MQSSPEKICIVCGKKARWIGIWEIYVCDSCEFIWEMRNGRMNFRIKLGALEWGRGLDIWQEVPQGTLLIVKETSE